MISKTRFGQLKQGDFILTKNKVRRPTVRQVAESCKNPLCVTLVRINTGYNPTTTYTYYDIAHKIVGVIKKK